MFERTLEKTAQMYGMRQNIFEGIWVEEAYLKTHCREIL
jgi:hypothetical protein